MWEINKRKPGENNKSGQIWGFLGRLINNTNNPKNPDAGRNPKKEGHTSG